MAKRKKVSKKWIQQHISDPYVKQAQQKGYRARAAFKLLEIIENENLIKPGHIIVDLGATPGSWSQVVREKLLDSNNKVNGRIIALDLLPMEPIEDVEFIQGDFREESILNELESKVEGKQVDLVLSDMAPNLSGISASDSVKIQHVCELALEFAINHLKPNGVLIVKNFHGSGFSQIVEQYKKYFKKVVEKKPKASRDRSAETFLIARHLK